VSQEPGFILLPISTIVHPFRLIMLGNKMILSFISPIDMNGNMTGAFFKPIHSMETNFAKSKPERFELLYLTTI